jgi:DNA-directed RNA polymerase specialized sigma24 family protein
MDESFAQPLPRSDAELINAAGSGDEAAFETLRERHTAAARGLAAELSADPADADAIVALTFTQIGNLVKDGRGPRVALRPYLFTSVRWAAHERLTGGSGNGAETAPPAAGTEVPGTAVSGPGVSNTGVSNTVVSNTGDAATTVITGTNATAAEAAGAGEPLFTDPAIADLVRSPLYLAFMSLPERMRAAAWHADIEHCTPEETGAVLGLTPDGAADLARQARTALREAYLRQFPVAQDAELADLGGPLRTIVGPVFLGSAAAGYLSAAHGPAGPAGQGLGGLRWMRQGPNQAASGRSRRVLTAGGVALGLLAATGLFLALTSASGSQAPTASPVHALGAAPASSSPSGSPSPLPSATSSSPVATTLSTPAPTPTPTASPAPAPTTLPPPLPTPTVQPTQPPSSPSPTPSPTCTPILPGKHHRCPTPPPA